MGGLVLESVMMSLVASSRELTQIAQRNQECKENGVPVPVVL